MVRRSGEVCRKQMDEEGTGSVVVEVYGGGLCSAVDSVAEMMMMMKHYQTVITKKKIIQKQ